MAIENEHLPEMLRYQPWPPWDPVPWWILRVLDDRVIRQVAVIQLESQRAVLEVQQKAIEKTLGAIKGK